MRWILPAQAPVTSTADTQCDISRAEQRVWSALVNDLHPDDVALPNVRLTDRHGDHEADLILGFAGLGIAVIEVKGGRVSHNSGGWVQHGATTKRIDPVGQARRTQNALRHFLEQQSAWGARRVHMAHLIALPFSSVTAGEPPDCARWQVLDKHAMAAGAADAVRDALATELKESPATAADLTALVACLRGSAPTDRPRGFGRWWSRAA